jgi:hypothetical protein
MQSPFEDLTSADHLASISVGIKVLYHRGYDIHYIRSEGEEKIFWYEITSYGARIDVLSDREQDALEEQFQAAKEG